MPKDKRRHLRAKVEPVSVRGGSTFDMSKLAQASNTAVAENDAGHSDAFDGLNLSTTVSSVARVPELQSGVVNCNGIPVSYTFTGQNLEEGIATISMSMPNGMGASMTVRQRKNGEQQEAVDTRRRAIAATVAVGGVVAISECVKGNVYLDSSSDSSHRAIVKSRG